MTTKSQAARTIGRLGGKAYVRNQSPEDIAARAARARAALAAKFKTPEEKKYYYQNLQRISTEKKRAKRLTQEQSSANIEKSD